MFASERALVVAMLVTAAGLTNAHAAPVRWELENVTFQDGGTAVGSFVYDADTNALSMVAITTAGGAFAASGAGASYTQPAGGFFDPLPPFLVLGFEDATLDLDPSLFIRLSSAMTNNGGLIPIFLGPRSIEFFIADPPIDPPSAQGERYIVSGEIISTVPVPPAVWLFGSALGLMGMMRRKIGS